MSVRTSPAFRTSNYTVVRLVPGFAVYWETGNDRIWHGTKCCDYARSNTYGACGACQFGTADGRYFSLSDSTALEILELWWREVGEDVLSATVMASKLHSYLQEVNDLSAFQIQSKHPLTWDGVIPPVQAAGYERACRRAEAERRSYGAHNTIAY